MAQLSESGQEAWRPAGEPGDWTRIREELIQLGPPRGLASREWVYLRSLDRPEMQAGEYVADIVPSERGKQPTAEFTGVVLLRRGGPQGEWEVRERRMRVLCRSGQLEVRSVDGGWMPYEGKEDPETPQRRGWICARAAAADQ